MTFPPPFSPGPLPFSETVVPNTGLVPTCGFQRGSVLSSPIWPGAVVLLLVALRKARKWRPWSPPLPNLLPPPPFTQRRGRVLRRVGPAQEGQRGFLGFSARVRRGCSPAAAARIVQETYDPLPIPLCLLGSDQLSWRACVQIRNYPPSPCFFPLKALDVGRRDSFREGPC